MGGGGGVAEASESDAGVTIHIRCSNGSKFSVQITLVSTVGSFKSVLAHNCDIPAEHQRLIYKGRILKDDQTLQSYANNEKQEPKPSDASSPPQPHRNFVTHPAPTPVAPQLSIPWMDPVYVSNIIENCVRLEADHTVHLVRGFAPTASTNTGLPNSTPSGVRSVGSDEGGAFGGSGLGDSLFSGLGFNGLGGNSGLFGAGLPEFEQVQQQLTQNPNMMREIMSMPVVQNLMNNPDIMRNLIMNNPQMRELIDRNPELAHILNDPSTLRQTLEAARNPELMREMMRNTDRAMSNIEASPEGINMLRRMYENVQEPFLNATTMAGDTGNDPGSNPFAALLGTQNQSTNPASTGTETMANSPAPNSNPLPNPWASGGAGGAQTNSTTGSNPAGDTRLPAPGAVGLGGLGLPEFERMFGSLQGTASLSQFMQNPAMSQMMQSLLSNSQYMNQILALNPQLRNMLDSNPQLREMMQNPDFIRQLMSPETMQSTIDFTANSSISGWSATTNPGSGSNCWGKRMSVIVFPTDNMGLEMLMNMFGGLGTGSPTIPNRLNVPPEEQYATQLSQLQEMGFFDTQENIRALIATAGNVHAAVERLLGNPGL
ncbi:unnamed protein product [Camellia sinensis]